MIIRLVFIPWAIQTKIREAGLQDTDLVADFNLRMALETEQRRLDSRRVRKGVASLLADRSKGVYYLAEIQDKRPTEVAGQLLITYEWSDWRNGNFWWIQSVYVAESFRGQGVFRALVSHVRRLADARKEVCGLRLYMHASNRTARCVYERLAFKATHYEVFEIDFSQKH